MKKVMLGMVLLAGGLFAMPRVAVGVRFGVPAPAAVVRPVCPGPGYVWTAGYYGPRGWVAGYWAPPVRVRIAPHFDRDRFGNNRVEHFRR